MKMHLKVLAKFVVYYFPPIFIIWKENHLLNAKVFLNVYLPIEMSECMEDSEIENFLSPSYSKFAIECD